MKQKQHLQSLKTKVKACLSVVWDATCPLFSLPADVERETIAEFLHSHDQVLLGMFCKATLHVSCTHALSGDIAGVVFGCTARAAGQINVTGIIVDPRYQGVGMGRKLVNAFEVKAAAAGHNKLVVEEERCHLRACEFWQKLGYGVQSIEGGKSQKRPNTATGRQRKAAAPAVTTDGMFAETAVVSKMLS